MSVKRLASLPQDQQDAILKRWDEGRKRRQSSDQRAREAVGDQTKGAEYLKDKNIGLKQEQKGDVRELIKKWLRASERGVGHSQDPERGEKNLERIKNFIYSKYVPTLETFPREEFIRVQNEAALAQGWGRAADQVSAEIINQWINQEIGNIKDSLDPWIEYFTSPDSSYIPIWAKYWSFMGVVRMSGIMKTDELTGKVSFPKREKNTINGFPELNPEALAKAVDYILALVEKGQKLDVTLTKENFSDVYSHFISELKGGLDQTELQITEGTWVKYDQGNDDEAIDTLVDSLQGKFTNWCTAGRSTAKRQLAAGDFYVYYTKSDSGKPNPRIAIRMEGKKIVEIRGISGLEQNLDEVISGTDILEQKLTQFGEEGEKYKIRAENMRRLTVIYNKLRKDSAYQLPYEDLKFLRETPEGFGYREDPRIDEILSFSKLRKNHDITEIDDATIVRIMSKISPGDILLLLKSLSFVNSKYHPQIANRLIYAGYGQDVSYRLNNIKGLNLNSEYANKLIDSGQGSFVARCVGKFNGLNHVEIANRLIDSGQGHWLAYHLKNFNGLNHVEIANRLIDSGQGQAVASYLSAFKGLNSEIAEKLLSKGLISKTKLEEFRSSFIDIDYLLN